MGPGISAERKREQPCDDGGNEESEPVPQHEPAEEGSSHDDRRADDRRLSQGVEGDLHGLGQGWDFLLIIFIKEVREAVGAEWEQVVAGADGSGCGVLPVRTPPHGVTHSNSGPP